MKSHRIIKSAINIRTVKLKKKIGAIFLYLYDCVLNNTRDVLSLQAKPGLNTQNNCWKHTIWTENDFIATLKKISSKQVNNHT